MIGISSFLLHILAMIFMTFDHIWATFPNIPQYFTWIGRLAFPIFAFLLVEGYFHTKDLKKYKKRLFIFALLSEIPFNLMYSGEIIYPFHQNVLWTFLIGIIYISKLEKIKEIENLPIRILRGAIAIIASYLIGLLTMVDYYGNGILMILIFYFFRGKEFKYKLAQIIGIFIINFILIKGQVLPINLGNINFDFPVQGFAILSLIPIFLYKGKQGLYNKFIKYFYYLYYPLHALILYFISILS